MLLRFRGLACPVYVKVSKRLLSNQIKEILNTRLDPPKGASGVQFQLAAVRKNLNAINLDIFVNNLSQNEDRSSDVIDLLASIRTTKLANTCLESTHFAVVKHLLEHLTIQEVVPILLDRPKYGIFLNNFTAFSIFQILHEEKEHLLGLPLALKLLLSAEVDSIFVQGFFLKASLETLKKKSLEQSPCDGKNITLPKGKIQEKKIRVKFIRNTYEPNIYNEIGKALLKIESKGFNKNTKANIEILGFVLTKKYDELSKVLGDKGIEICSDIAEISNKILSQENNTDFVNKINKLQSQLLFGNIIDEFLKEVSKEEVGTLVEKQKQLFPIWQQQRIQKKIEYDNDIIQKERKDNIDVIRNEIASKKELLWFFDQEDNIDLEIYKKEQLQTKNHIDKNKKASVVDEHYVPPEIRKINKL